MTSRDFCYWLQGFLEVAKPQALTAEQTALVQSHLSMVFVHEIDPSFPAKQQGALTAAHLTAPAKPGEPVPRC